MVEIRNAKDLEAWLTNRPREDAAAIATRAALRMLPLVGTAVGRHAGRHRAMMVLPYFCAAAAAWVPAIGPTRSSEVRQAFVKSAKFAFAASVSALIVDDNFGVAPAALGRAIASLSRVAAAADTAAKDAAEAVDAAVDAAAYAAAAAAQADADAAAQAAADAARVVAWKAVSADGTALAGETAAGQVLALPLWPDTSPGSIVTAWAKLRQHLLEADEGWEVWTDWYEARLHGRPFDKTLEEARVLIDPDLWEEGPKAVNAAIKRLIVERQAREGPATPDFDQPELPDQRPTPIRFEFRNGALHRAAHAPPHPPDERRIAAQRGWQALQEMLDDFVAVGGGRQNRRLKLVLERCQAAMGGSFEALEVILLGAHAARLQGLAERADEVLMPEDAADLVALNAQLALFLAQFPEWADYASGIGEGFGAPEAERKAVADSTAAIEHIAEAAPELIASDAKDGLAELAEAATPEPTVGEPAPVAPPIQRRSFLRAVRSALGALAGKAVADVKAGFSKGVQKHVESTTAAVLSGAQAHLIALATGLPGEFGWLAGLVTYFTRMLGPSAGGAPEKRDGPDDAGDQMEA